MLSVNFIIFLILTISRVNSYFNPHFVGNRSTIVHLFEWKWKDIASECEEFLGPNGYGGVQVSPVTENIVIGNRPWFERYQPISYKFVTRSGNRAELFDMIKRCNNADVRIYIDAVNNHMIAPSSQPYGTDKSIANFELLDFPEVPYTKDDFHEPCDIISYSNVEQIRNCTLVGLSDLDQSKKHVREKILDYMNELIEMGVAGFRIDAAKHMWPQDLEQIYKNLNNLNTEFNFPKNSRPFIYQEVIDLGSEAIKKSEYSSLGVVTEFLHSAEICFIFRGQNQLKWLKTWGPHWNLLPSNLSLVFIDNHDNQRGHGAGGLHILTHKNEKLYTLASAFMLAHPYGITQVMSSFNFTDPNQGPPSDDDGNIKSATFDSLGYCAPESGWVCEHRWNQIANMVIFRNFVHGTELSNWWDNGNYQIAFCRGDKGFIVMNLENKPLKQSLQTCLPAGQYCDIFGGNLLSSGRCSGTEITVTDNGLADFDMSDENNAIALHIGAKL